MVAVGVYGADALQSLRFATARLLVAVSLGTIFLSLIFFLVPALTFWRSNLLYAMGIAAVAMIALRILLGKTLGRSAEHKSEVQSLMRISYAVFCLKYTTIQTKTNQEPHNTIYTHI